MTQMNSSPADASTPRTPARQRLWSAQPVQRPDAGNLWNAVDCDNIEAPETPTHSKQLAQQYADALNVRESSHGR